MNVAAVHIGGALSVNYRVISFFVESRNGTIVAHGADFPRLRATRRGNRYDDDDDDTQRAVAIRAT